MTLRITYLTKLKSQLEIAKTHGIIGFPQANIVTANIAPKGNGFLTKNMKTVEIYNQKYYLTINACMFLYASQKFCFSGTYIADEKIYNFWFKTVEPSYK